MELEKMEPLAKAIDTLLDNWEDVLDMAEEIMGEDFDDDLAGELNDFLLDIQDGFDFLVGEEPGGEEGEYIAPEVEEGEED